MNLQDIPTVCYNEEKQTMDIIDQTLLPNIITVISLDNKEDVWEAINVLRVRGAPAIGVSAAIGLYVCTKDLGEENFYNEFVEVKDYLNSSRPTAVNLEWALNRMHKVLDSVKDKAVSEIKEILKAEAIAIYNEDIEVCRKIGEYGLELINENSSVLTHCNAGKLAAVQYGTATAPMYVAKEQGYKLKIHCDETRPLLQGARLTAFELAASDMDVTLLCDSASDSLMREGKVDAIFVGCDRVAANGDTANKVGTSMVANAAKKYNVPLYVCAPTSTIDMFTENGKDIHIEQRNAEEVTELWYSSRMAPKNIKVYNPAFDVTDADLVTAFVTEYGIIRKPFKENFAKLFKEIKR